MKKKILIINILLACAVFGGNYFYLTEGGLLLKSLCSSGFALMGIINLIYALMSKKEDLKFNISMSIGLILAMLGDIVLGFNFIIGATLFALGHICYFTAQSFLINLKKLDFIISGMLFVGAGTFLLFCPLLSFNDPIKRWVCFVYAFIISLMVGKAISNAIQNPGVLTAMLAVGSVLFFISDLMLVFDWFIGLWDWTGKVCMATYYPAQCLLAFSAFYVVKEELK